MRARAAHSTRARTHAVERERALFGRYHVRLDSRTAEAADRDGEGHVVVVILDAGTAGLSAQAAQQRREGGRHGMRMIDTGVLGRLLAPRVAVCPTGTARALSTYLPTYRISAL